MTQYQYLCGMDVLRIPVPAAQMLLDALRAWEPRALGSERLTRSYTGQPCALGVLLMFWGKPPFYGSLDGTPFDLHVREVVYCVNDTCDETPENRYQRMLAWAESQVAQD